MANQIGAIPLDQIEVAEIDLIEKISGPLAYSYRLAIEVENLKRACS